MATAREEIINIFESLPARYDIGEIEVEPEPIATGLFGSLHKGWWGGRADAVKKFDLENTDDNFNLAAKEMSRTIRLRHQNVLHVHGFYFVAAKGRALKCSMVMELMDFDLDKYMEQERLALTDDEVVYVIAEIARGMNHLHENGYAHRDLKPQNVLMRRSAVLTSFNLEVKVADFGSSELMSAGQCERTAGTLRYKAPKQFERVGPLQADKMDVYSFGCTCFKLWTGEDPPVKNHGLLMELWEQRRGRNLVGDVEGIITECLNLDPDARPGFREISGTLDAVLKLARQVEQVPYREQVRHEEMEGLVARRSEIVRELGFDRVENGLDYADYVIFPEELALRQLVSEAVYGVEWKGTLCALKVFDSCTSEASSEGLKRLPTLIHENIVRFLGYSLNYHEAKRVGIVMEFLCSDLRNFLFDFRRKHWPSISLPEQRRWKIMKGIAEGMKFLHGKGMVHGDLKPANVLVNVSDQAEDASDDIVVKLIDFSFVEEPILCTTFYAAPEVLQARSVRDLRGRIDYKKSDVYSFAITCSDILSGVLNHSWYRSGPSRFKMEVINGWKPELPEETSEELKDLIERCWHPNPAERPCFGDICDFFSQPMPRRACNPVHVHAKNSCTLL